MFSPMIGFSFLKSVYSIHNTVKLLLSNPLLSEFSVIGLQAWSPNSFLPHSPEGAVRVLFSSMVSGWAGGLAVGKSLSGLYLRNRKV